MRTEDDAAEPGDTAMNNGESDHGTDALPDIHLRTDQRQAILGGVVAGIIVLAGMFLINVSSGSEARFLLEAMLPSVRFLCSAVMTASATILALMLTMLSFSGQREAQLKTTHYERVRQIALVDTITFAAAIILLLILSLPLAESQDVPQSWYTVVYYLTMFYAAALGGALISIVLLLYHAIVDMIRVMHPEARSELVVRDQ